MDYIYGKLNQKAQLTEYRGLSTDSSTVVVDNTNKTIRVDFTGSISGSLGGGKINSISVNGNKLTIDDKKNVDITIPYATSQLANDADFVTNAVDNLLNYYIKTEVYNQDEIDYKLEDIRQLIQTINVQGVKFEVIDTLPDLGEPNAIYLLNTSSGNYTQWVYVNNNWLEISQEVDLSYYITEQELQDALNGIASLDIVDQKVQEAINQLNALMPTEISQLNNDLNYVTANYVDENGGKIDAIYVNDELQAIEDKAVKIIIPDSNGFNDVVINGEGNAITTASYDAETKILTLDKETTFLTEHQPLEDYAKKNEILGSANISIDPSTYVITLACKDAYGNDIGTNSTIDLPLESVVVGGRYDDSTKKVILTLDNEQTVEFSVADLVDGLQNAITADNKLNADLVDDTNSTNKFVTEQEKASWTNKQDAITVNNKIDSSLIDDTQSNNKFITAEQISKLADIQDGAEKNIQSDWLATDTAAAILNKPTKLSDFENDLDNYYTKDQTYSKETVYTKEETYAKSEVYTKQETYTKAEIEALIQTSIKNNVEAAVNEIMEGSY